MSDTVDTVCTGQWDGDIRTLSQSFEFLEKLEKSSNFPEYFNPEVFGMVVTWIKSGKAEEFKDEAVSVVADQVKNVVSEELAS